MKKYRLPIVATLIVIIAMGLVFVPVVYLKSPDCNPPTVNNYEYKIPYKSGYSDSTVFKQEVEGGYLYITRSSNALATTFVPKVSK